eukprot:103871_1
MASRGGLYVAFCCCLYLVSGLYDIGHYTVVIENPTNSRLNISVIIHYPKVTNTNIQFPAVVFNHGWTCHNTWYDYVWQAMVPLGYIVAMPGDDEDVINDETGKQYAGGQRGTLDYLRSQCNGNTHCPIYGLVGNKSAAMGHSMGGGATIMSVSGVNLGAEFKYAFDAGFTYSGCGGTTQAVKSIKKPFFLMTATHDCICNPNTTSEKYYTEIPDNAACKMLGDITNGDHCNFEDGVFANECRALENSECPADKNDISAKEQQDITIGYTKLFLNATLYNENSKVIFSQITQKLQSDVKSGVMADVKSGSQC